jgi:hypothetical protein
VVAGPVAGEAAASARARFPAFAVPPPRVVRLAFAAPARVRLPGDAPVLVRVRLPGFAPETSRSASRGVAATCARPVRATSV